MLAVKAVFVPLLPIAAIGYGISLMLNWLDTMVYSIVLPFVVMGGTLVVMLCPWPLLTSKNLMLVIFYLMVASPLSLRNERDPLAQEELDEVPTWFLLSFIGTASIGLFVAFSVHFILSFTPRSTASTRLSREMMKQLSYQTYSLLYSVSLWANNLGTDTQSIMRARGLIEYYITSRKNTLQLLSNSIDAIRVETNLPSCSSINSKYLGMVEEFIEFAQKQQQYTDMIQFAISNLLLGEESTLTNETIKEMKIMMSHHLGSAVEKLATEYRGTEHAYFFSSSEVSVDALQSCLKSYLLAMRNAIRDADELSVNSSAKSLTGPKIRSRVIFHAVSCVVHELLDVITPRTTDARIQSTEPESIYFKFKTSLKMPWLWNNTVKCRLAFKTSLALGLASLWVAIPHLREVISYPNAAWVGITVAIVSLENTGAAITKCYDRLWGTLIAAAVALLVARILPVQNNAVAISTYALYTFVAILFQDKERPYAMQCSVSALASILFGSLYNMAEVDYYVTQRILLIFVGVATFLFVELALFPRSSRIIVQSCTIKYFDDLQCFLVNAGKACDSISSFECEDCEVPDRLREDPLFMLRQGHEEVSSLTACLADGISRLKDTVSISNNELRPALQEPSLGLHIKLHGIGYEKLLAEQERCISQLKLLTTCINSLIGYYSFLPKTAQIRELHWPSLLATTIDQVAQQHHRCINSMKVAFPNGLCEPGSCSVSNTITAISDFRNFEATRISILTQSFAERHTQYYNMLMAMEGAAYIPGFRITLALASSAILSIAECLQHCGLHLEEIVRAFPLRTLDFEDC